MVMGPQRGPPGEGGTEGREGQREGDPVSGPMMGSEAWLHWSPPPQPLALGSTVCPFYRRERDLETRRTAS
jgi:hypothetical protein